MVKDIYSGSSAGVPWPIRALITDGNMLYFKANDGTNGDELWCAQLTPDGAGLATHHEISYS